MALPGPAKTRIRIAELPVGLAQTETVVVVAATEEIGLDVKAHRFVEHGRMPDIQAETGLARLHGEVAMLVMRRRNGDGRGDEGIRRADAADVVDRIELGIAIQS